MDPKWESWTKNGSHGVKMLLTAVQPSFRWLHFWLQIGLHGYRTAQTKFWHKFCKNIKQTDRQPNLPNQDDFNPTYPTNPRQPNQPNQTNQTNKTNTPSLPQANPTNITNPTNKNHQINPHNSNNINSGMWLMSITNTFTQIP